MAIEGIHNPLAAGFNATAAAHGTEGPHGLFMGHAVKVEATPEKLLADAAEEIGFALDKTQDYEISRRKERNAARISEEVLARYRAHLEEAGKSEAMHSTIESLKHAADAKSFRQALEEAFPDPADAWAVLEAAREAFAEDPAVSNDQKATLERVREEFFAQNRRDIALGMRGAVTGLDFGDLDGASALGSLYRDTVGEFTDVNEVYSDISARYGEKFDKAMDFLFAAISADIESAAPSLEITQLESVHRKLGEVRLTRSAHILCTEVLNRWKDVHGGVTTLTPMWAKSWRFAGSPSSARIRSTTSQGRPIPSTSSTKCSFCRNSSARCGTFPWNSSRTTSTAGSLSTPCRRRLTAPSNAKTNGSLHKNEDPLNVGTRTCGFRRPHRNSEPRLGRGRRPYAHLRRPGLAHARLPEVRRGRLSSHLLASRAARRSPPRLLGVSSRRALDLSSALRPRGGDA